LWRAAGGGGILEEGFSMMLVLAGILWLGREYGVYSGGEWLDIRSMGCSLSGAAEVYFS
jgi:hypothetical protein